MLAIDQVAKRACDELKCGCWLALAGAVVSQRAVEPVMSHSALALGALGLSPVPTAPAGQRQRAAWRREWSRAPAGASAVFMLAAGAP